MKPMQQIIDDVCQFSPRQGEGETQTSEYIMQFLKQEGIPFRVEEYETIIPRIHSARLELEGSLYQSPDVEGCSLVGGDIGSHAGIIDSTCPSPFLYEDYSNLIAHNPYSTTASPATFFRIPDLAVAKHIHEKILAMKKYGKVSFQGSVQVEKQSHTGRNILVGNVDNPKTLFITHYDSINKGALDNASGVAVVQHAIVNLRENMQDVLFAICGTEELSYDQLYWGNGYRALEKAMPHLFEKADKIVAIDSVGNAAPTIMNTKADVEICHAAIPLHNFRDVQEKIRVVIGDIYGKNGLFSVYHSWDDDGRNLSEEHLQTTRDMLISMVQT